MKIMLDCRTVSSLLSQSQDHTLPPATQVHMRLHMLSCVACRSVDEQMRFLRTATKRLELDEAIDPTLTAQAR